MALLLPERASAAVGKKPLQYVHSHANTSTVKNHDSLRSLTDLFFALWGVTTPISFGMPGCENMHLRVS